MGLIALDPSAGVLSHAAENGDRAADFNPQSACGQMDHQKLLEIIRRK
jgi:hypothetical protein